jgi:hypothetical protein
MSDETIEKTFQVTDPARLVISNIRGSITIQPGEANVINIRAVKHGSFDSSRHKIEIAQEQDGTVRVETRSSDSTFGLFSQPPKVEYDVRVPQGIHLEASGVSSTLNVSGLSGVFKLKTVSGDSTVTDLSGTLKLNAVSGDIIGSHLQGRLEVDSVSGSVKLLDSTFPSADATTVSGNMTLQTAIGEGPYVFGSVSGNVRMLVPADTRCNAELSSVSGSIRSSFPSNTTRLGHGQKVTLIQGGGTAVRLKSVSGDLSIETEGIVPTAVPTIPQAEQSPIPPIPPIPPISPSPVETPAPAPLSTAEILQRIESGEMTVDEAIKLMKGQS